MPNDNGYDIIKQQLKEDLAKRDKDLSMLCDSKVVGVQSMNVPLGIVAALNFKYANDKEEKVQMKTYRFKTEQELINDYGHDWKNRDFNEISWNCGGRMDYLFGVDISQSLYDFANREGTVEFEDWIITSEWLTDKPIPNVDDLDDETIWNDDDDFFESLKSDDYDLKSSEDDKRGKKKSKKQECDVNEVKQHFERGSEKFFHAVKPGPNSSTKVSMKFLPSPDAGKLIGVDYYHSFICDNGDRFMEKCLHTIDEACPICDMNQMFINNGEAERIERMHSEKRHCNYLNVLILNDEENPHNNGKVFVLDICESLLVLKPDVDIFNNATFNLVVERVGLDELSYHNSYYLYDDLKIDKSVLKHTYDLCGGEFKSYDEIKENIEKVLNIKIIKAMTPDLERAIDKKVKDVETEVVQHVDGYIKECLTETMDERIEIITGKKLKTKKGGLMKTLNKSNFTDITKRVWNKNATANAEAAKSAARRRIGDIVNNNLADVILKTVEMPKWLVLIGGRKWLRPVVKLAVANLGIFALGFIESQGYKSKKAEFVADAMLEAGYDDLVGLVNLDNISDVVDKVIEAIPECHFNEAGYTSSTVERANDFLDKAEPEVPADDLTPPQV